MPKQITKPSKLKTFDEATGCECLRFDEPNCTCECHDVAKSAPMGESSEGLEKQRIKTEASIFFSKISEYLPRSLERSALGDENIYRAFFQAYTEFRPHLLTSAHSELKKEFVKDLEEYDSDSPLLLNDLIKKYQSPC